VIREAQPRRRGFTLVELLTVISIIILLLAMLAPAYGKIQRQIKTQASQAVIGQLDLACRQYRGDFGDFPPSQAAGYTMQGSQLMALFLTGYGPDTGSDGTPSGLLNVDDGVDGPGFRVEARGKIYGPYGDVDKLRAQVKYYDPGNGLSVTCPRFFVDAFNNPILYYRFNPSSGYSAANNASGPGFGPATVDSYARGYVPGGSYLRKDFLLISCGADVQWCPTTTQVGASDDVTNLFPNK